MSDNKIIVSINGNKKDHTFDSLSLNMPSEAADLLALMQSQALIKKSVSTTSHDLKSIIESAPVESLSIVRKTPELVSSSLIKKDFIENIKSETDPIKKLMIDESGKALGIIVGNTKKQEVTEIMSNFSKNSPVDDGLSFFYNDLSVSIFFDDDIVSEIKFGHLYKGSTIKGLFIGETVEKAIEIYGQPKLKSAKGVMWNKFAIFCEKNIISAIRIQK